MVNGIETRYRGVTFRSRLEARWATFFDAVGWDWQYEPFDANGYIPDFVLTGPMPVLIEVKPAVTWNDYVGHTDRLEAALKNAWYHDVLIVGVSPVIPAATWHGYQSYLSKPWSYPWGESAKCIGLLSDSSMYDAEGFGMTLDHWYWEPAHWDHRSDPWGDPSGLGFFHPYNGYAARPHAKGENSHPSPISGGERILDLWRRSADKTRWLPKNKVS